MSESRVVWTSPDKKLRRLEAQVVSDKTGAIYTTWAYQCRDDQKQPWRWCDWCDTSKMPPMTGAA